MGVDVPVLLAQGNPMIPLVLRTAFKQALKNTWQLLPAKDAGLAGVIRLLHRVESYWFAIPGRHAP